MKLQKQLLLLENLTSFYKVCTLGYQMEYKKIRLNLTFLAFAVTDNQMAKMLQEYNVALFSCHGCSYVVRTNQC